MPDTPMISAEQLLLGDDLLPWLLLAVGAALAVANIAAVVRPPREEPGDPDSPRREPAPLSRAIPFVALGVLVAAWAIASLLKG